MNRYLRTRVDITVGEAQDNTKVDAAPKLRARELRHDNREGNGLKVEKAI